MSAVTIVGSGFIGRAWAISFARAGHEVRLWDQSPEATRGAHAYISGVLADLAANDLLPLTPEQLCWSALQATGQMETFRKTSAAQYDAKNKPTEADKIDPKKQAERTAAIEVSVREKQRGFEPPFTGVVPQAFARSMAPTTRGE